MTNLQRHATDSTKVTDIESMIAAEDDSKARALLIVLNSINNSMVANTAMTRDVANKLDRHLTSYEAHVSTESDLVARGMGAWKVVAWVLGLAQILILAGTANVISKFNEHDKTFGVLAVKDESLDGFDKQIEGRVNALEQWRASREYAK